jgi:hypothetical protein
MAVKSSVVQSSLLVAAGWLCSVIDQLRGIAYKTITALALLVPIVLLQTTRVRWRLPLRRFRQPLALAFASLCLVASLGGISRAPNNYDGSSYRMPRLLAWLGAGHLTWISTTSRRLNYSAANFQRFDDRKKDEPSRSFRAEMGGS